LSPAPFDLHTNYWKMRQYHKEIPRGRLLAIEDQWTDLKRLSRQPTLRIVLGAVGVNGSLLDVGAGARQLEGALRLAGFKGVYKSVDIDPYYHHDYGSLKEVKEQFDVVTMFEIVEHLEVPQTIEYICTSLDILKPNGKLVVSTRNPSHLTAMWSGDITHIRQYPPGDLYGILRLAGFQGKIDYYRIYQRPIGGRGR